MMQELQINSYFFAPNLRMKLSSDTLILLLHNDISAFFMAGDNYRKLQTG